MKPQAITIAYNNINKDQRRERVTILCEGYGWPAPRTAGPAEDPIKYEFRVWETRGNGAFLRGGCREGGAQ